MFVKVQLQNHKTNRCRQKKPNPNYTVIWQRFSRICHGNKFACSSVFLHRLFSVPNSFPFMFTSKYLFAFNTWQKWEKKRDYKRRRYLCSANLDFSKFLQHFSLVRNVMDVNEHERLSNITCRHKIYHRNGSLWINSTKE